MKPGDTNQTLAKPAESGYRPAEGTVHRRDLRDTGDSRPRRATPRVAGSLAGNLNAERAAAFSQRAHPTSDEHYVADPPAALRPGRLPRAVDPSEGGLRHHAGRPS